MVPKVEVVPKALVPKAWVSIEALEALVPNKELAPIPSNLVPHSSIHANPLESSRWAHAQTGAWHSLPVAATEEAYIQTEVKLGSG